MGAAETELLLNRQIEKGPSRQDHAWLQGVLARPSLIGRERADCSPGHGAGILATDFPRLPNRTRSPDGGIADERGSKSGKRPYGQHVWHGNLQELIKGKRGNTKQAPTT